MREPGHREGKSLAPGCPAKPGLGRRQAGSYLRFNPAQAASLRWRQTSSGTHKAHVAQARCARQLGAPVPLSRMGAGMGAPTPMTLSQGQGAVSSHPHGPQLVPGTAPPRDSGWKCFPTNPRDPGRVGNIPPGCVNVQRAAPGSPPRGVASLPRSAAPCGISLSKRWRLSRAPGGI